MSYHLALCLFRTLLEYYLFRHQSTTKRNFFYKRCGESVVLGVEWRWKRGDYMKSFYEELGKRIRHYRNLSGLTLEELGKRVGVGKSTVRKYEVGDIKIDQIGRASCRERV